MTSWGELNRDGVEIEKERLRHPDRPAGTPYVTKVLADARGPGRRGVGLDAGGARADPAVGARHLRHAGHRRLRLLRHPARGAALLQHRRRVGRGRGAGGPGPRRRTSTSRSPSRQPASTRSTTCWPRRSRRQTPASPDYARRLVGGTCQHNGVAFRDGRQSVRPAEVHARGAGDGAGLGVAPVEAVLRPAGHRGGARHGGAAAVLRRPRGVAAGQRATGGAGRGGQLRRVDARPAEQRQLHGAGVRGGPAGSAAAHRAAAVGRDGAGHDGVLRGSRAAAGPLRRAADRADRRNPALQPGFGVRRRQAYADQAEARGAWDTRMEANVVDAVVRGDTGPGAAVAGRRAELGRHRARPP